MKSILSEQREADEALCKRLDRNAGWRDERWRCITDPNLLAEAASRIRALSEALQEACHERDGLLVPEWQPIETAPKDGTVIWLAKEGHMRLGLWTNGAEHENHGTKDGGWIDWVNAHGTGPRGLRFAPTHWMPLPTPPGEK